MGRKGQPAMNEMISRIKYGGILLAVTGAAYFTLVRPAYNTRATVLAEVKALTSRVALADEDFASRDRARRRLASLQSRLDQETKAIPESSDVAGVISGISTDIRYLGLSGQKLDRGKDTAVGSTASSGLMIETTGQFDVVIDLLRRVEALPRLVRISSLTAQNLDHNSGVVKATIGLDVYYRIAGETAAAPTKP